MCDQSKSRSSRDFQLTSMLFFRIMTSVMIFLCRSQVDILVFRRFRVPGFVWGSKYEAEACLCRIRVVVYVFCREKAFRKKMSNFLSKGLVSRPASHAGSWYDDRESVLRSQLEDLLTNTGQTTCNPNLKAIICPHAGYRSD
jgi:hypothetical protein